MSPFPDLPLCAESDDVVELAVVDLGVARALWEGVPTGRLLARIRLHRDEHDLVDFDQRTSGVDFADASWDIALSRVLAFAPASLERVKRAVARHARAAAGEGPLAASDASIAALIQVFLSSADTDASPAEGAAEALAIEEPVRVACGQLDERLARTPSDRRDAAFEACLELVKRTTTPAWPLETLRATLGAIAATQQTDLHDAEHAPSREALPNTGFASSAALYPSAGDHASPAERRACFVDRAHIERLVLGPERELASTIQRATVRYPGLPIAKLVADVAACVAKHGALLLVVKREARTEREAPPLPPASWAPVGVDAYATVAALAAALERGAVTAPRARSILVRGGETARDAIGEQMLDVAAHPFASAVFAEVLAPLARERDVVRLVAYFAVAPDPTTVAHALSLCSARDVVATVLRSWLEAMLPVDGVVAASSADPDTSASARVASCIAALKPYPALYEAVRPLLSRLPKRDAQA